MFTFLIQNLVEICSELQYSIGTQCGKDEAGSKDDALVAGNGVHVQAEEGTTGYAVHRNPDKKKKFIFCTTERIFQIICTMYTVM